LGDELRAALVLDGSYWAAAAFLRDEGEPWFTEDEVALLRWLCEPLADGFRRALLASFVAAVPEDGCEDAPGVIVFDERGDPESISPAAQSWIEQIPEVPAPDTPAQSKPVQTVATRARTLAACEDPLGLAARARVQTRSGRWLLLYGTQLSGASAGRTAVIIQPAPASEVAPLVALAYGLTQRERQVTHLCIQGLANKQIAATLQISQYTVQDHLKAIFEKTGARSRGELVGQVFLEHYVPRWETVAQTPDGWSAFATPPGAARAAVR
jgi:DNA-binding CsgD family transcriptional regulator